MNTPEVGQTPKEKLHDKIVGYISSWATATLKLRELMRRDYEFVNGRQATKQNMVNISKTGRELLFFNEIRPQFELLSGYRASQELDYVASPRGREDNRLGVVVSNLLKATYEVIKKSEISRKTGDDGDIGGLGVVYGGHTFDYAEDAVWGDLFLERISPFAFVFDAWGTSPQFQDGKYMGHAWWIHEDEFREAYPGKKIIPSEDWAQVLGNRTGGSDYEHTPKALLDELVNSDKKHMRIFKIYYKVPVTAYLVADSDTGDIFDGGTTEAEAKKQLKVQLKKRAESTLGNLEGIPQSTEEGISFVIVNERGEPVVDETGQQPLVLNSQEEVDLYIDSKIKELMNTIGSTWKVWTRKRHRIKWIELNGFEILAQGDLPVTTQKFPYRVYVSRHLGDEVEDIEGVVRQVIDRQKEITKRYNHLADHLAHSSHSGWLVRAGDPKLTQQLKLLGSQPGIVAEYNSVAPSPIQPSAIPVGHFNLLQENIGGMQRTTGMNAELLGLTSSSTVSGEAITARQRGGTTMLFGRIQNYMDFEKELADMMLYFIQTSMPVEKMRRILGVWEAKNQSNILGTSIFLDPVSGEPVQDDQILDLLSTMKSTKFDLILKPMPVDSSVREQQYMQALQMAQMIVQTGTPIGPTTFKMIGQMSNLPDMLLASMEADARAAQQAALAEQQLVGIQDAMKQQQSRRGPSGS